MRYVFFTFRPHPLDLQKFEDYIKLFLPFVSDHLEYAYAIEKDGTPDRHIHALLGSDTYRDLDKFKQAYQGKKRGMKQYQDMIARGCQTTALHGWDSRLLPDTEDDFSKTLGYIFKEVNPRMETNYTTQTVTDAVEHYYAHRRLDASHPRAKDWITVTKKNAAQHIPDFVEKFKEKYKISGIRDKKLPYYMAKERYMLVELSPKNYEVILQTLIIEADECTHLEQTIDRIYTAWGDMNIGPEDCCLACKAGHNPSMEAIKEVANSML